MLATVILAVLIFGYFVYFVYVIYSRFLKTGKETRSFKDVMNCPFYYARWA